MTKCGLEDGDAQDEKLEEDRTEPGPGIVARPGRILEEGKVHFHSIHPQFNILYSFSSNSHMCTDLKNDVLV